MKNSIWKTQAAPTLLPIKDSSLIEEEVAEIGRGLRGMTAHAKAGIKFWHQTERRRFVKNSPLNVSTACATF